MYICSVTHQRGETTECYYDDGTIFGQIEAVVILKLYKLLIKDTRIIREEKSFIMCVLTDFSILGLLAWGAYTAGKSAWKNRSSIAHYASNFYNLPETAYQAVKVKADRT